MIKPMSKAEQIRRMYDQGLVVAEIAQIMNIRYQHAYNVVTQYEKQRKVVGMRGNTNIGDGVMDINENDSQTNMQRAGARVGIDTKGN